jgi:hypothetical protein
MECVDIDASSVSHASEYSSDTGRDAVDGTFTKDAARSRHPLG